MMIHTRVKNNISGYEEREPMHGDCSRVWPCRLNHPNDDIVRTRWQFSSSPFYNIRPSIGIAKQRGGMLHELSNRRKAFVNTGGFGVTSLPLGMSCQRNQTNLNRSMIST
jgi:hypothetical protein